MKAVLFDLETSGMDPARHAIIQIAAIAVELEDLSEISEFECKVKFRLENASEDALKVNSYDPEVWDREAIVPSEACQRFTEFLDPFRDVRGISKRGKEYFTVQTIAYNARFDIEFLQGWYKRLGVFCPANWRAMCTMQLALWSFVGREQPENYQLGTVCRSLGIEIKGAHDAKADNQAQLELLRRLKGIQNETTAE